MTAIADLFTPPCPTTPQDRRQWGELYGASLSLAISQAVTQSQQFTLIVTPDPLTAITLENEIRCFLASTNQTIIHFPDWETLPYDQFSPHQDIISERLTTLYRLASLQRGVLIVPVTTLMHYLPPNTFLKAHTLLLDVGETVNLDQFRQQLTHAGYRSVSQVMEHGDFSIRGSIIDLFPMGSHTPYRIDLFDEEVDSIRTFDPESQRSTDTVDRIHLLPAREFPLTETAITRFRQCWRERFAGNPMLCPIYQNITEGLSAAGIEYYLPLFFEHTQTLFDYLPQDTLLVKVGNVQRAMEGFWEEITKRHEQYQHDSQRPLLPPEELFLPVNETYAHFNAFAQIDCSHEPAKHANFGTHLPPLLPLDRKAENPLEKLETFIQNYTGRVLLCVETAGRREALLELLSKFPLPIHILDSWHDFLSTEDRLSLMVAPIEQGLQLTTPAITLIAEPQLFGEQVMQRRRRKTQATDPDLVVRHLAELQIGSPIVHIDHGVGRYIGLQTLTINNVLSEFLTIEYADQDKLYVPVTSLHLISRYSGIEEEKAPVNRLGSDHWTKAKRKAAERAADVAAELLDIYARRAARVGHQFDPIDEHYVNFARAFPFEETPDQETAIEQVINDMTSPKPMDRLVCGDVGFGKTEVAMRATFMAIQGGKQVVLLVPTTLLAQQHFVTFKDRFADWPVRIELLSRFRSPKEQTAIIAQLRTGKIDLVIGTHKLLQPEIHFKNLGLLIIDEEHRFGVKQKDRIKALRTEVDILTLTATPIPRTLNMALGQLRDLSIIATPPARRLSINTFIQERDNVRIREAILRENLRGGQVYFLHNAVQSIDRIARELSELVPEARIAVAHGQMAERELERVMSDFYHHRFNVLVCTTIIESGIDIPTANTMIIDRADRFGLAQLHQLRGRVGRSHHQAYAYLLVPDKKILTRDATKRLEAIESLEDLGAGFMLATHDLEIRGAGELLGDEQSGHIHTIGFSLYMEILNQTIKALQAGETLDLDQPLKSGTEIDLKVPALIPETYIHDVHLRLMLYKRIASAENAAALDELQVEMIDRFGLLPEPLKNLFAQTQLKLLAESLGIKKIDANEHGGTLHFTPQTRITPARIIALIQSKPSQFKLLQGDRFRYTKITDTITERIAYLERIIKQLTQPEQEVVRD